MHTAKLRNPRTHKTQIAQNKNKKFTKQQLFPEFRSWHLSYRSSQQLFYSATASQVETIGIMIRLVFYLALVGAVLAPGSDAFVRPSIPLAGSQRNVAHPITSRPTSESVTSRSLKMSAAPLTAAPVGVKAPPDMYQNSVNVVSNVIRKVSLLVLSYESVLLVMPGANSSQRAFCVTFVPLRLY